MERRTINRLIFLREASRAVSLAGVITATAVIWNAGGSLHIKFLGVLGVALCQVGGVLMVAFDGKLSGFKPQQESPSI